MLTVQEKEFSDNEAGIEHKRSLKRKRGHRGLPEGSAGTIGRMGVEKTCQKPITPRGWM
jgi:hypothetical protein